MTDILASAAQLLGAGTVGAVLLKVVERIFARVDRRDDVAAGLRAEMVRRIEALETNYTALEIRERQSYERAVRLEAENLQLRRRWHALMNWMQSEPGLPTPPDWLDERIDGPTEDPAGHPARRPHRQSPEQQP